MILGQHMEHRAATVFDGQSNGLAFEAILEFFEPSMERFGGVEELALFDLARTIGNQAKSVSFVTPV